MKILTISGSSRSDSANVKFLNSLYGLFPNVEFLFFDISVLPLFKDSESPIQYPELVKSWQTQIRASDALIISTPEYIHNIPAALKNALEWVTQSGELHAMKVLPITFTPSPPRGEKAMKSLIWSLQALNMNVVGQLDLYQSELEISNNKITATAEDLELITEAIKSLVP